MQARSAEIRESTPDSAALHPGYGWKMSRSEMKPSISTLTGKDNYFEDFEVGAVYEHARGRTITEMDNVMITHLVMNTAQGHFNEDRMSKGPFRPSHQFRPLHQPRRCVIGLASEDTAEQAARRTGARQNSFQHAGLPRRHVVRLHRSSCEEGRRPPGRGRRRVPSRRVESRKKVVFTGERTTLIKRRSHWGTR